MNAFRCIPALALSLCCAVATAAPGQPDRDDGKPGQQQQQQQQQHQQQKQNPGQSQAHAQGQGQAHSSNASRNAPPQDFSQVRQQIQQHRAEIGHGGNLPANVRPQAGKPLPSGYGKRLPSATLAKLPHYDGYEWRRLGSDMVLVAVTTGIVYTVLSGVLN